MGAILRIIILLTILYSSLWSTLLDQQLQLNLQNEQQRVKSLYEMNSNHPLWVGHAKNFHTLMDAIANPYYNYKNKRFFLDTIEQYSHLLQNNMDVNQNSQELAELDIALTKSYIALARFIVKSDIDWDLVASKLIKLEEEKDIKARWEMVIKNEASISELFNAIINENIDEFFKSLTPLEERHSQLIESLQEYRNMQDMGKIPYSKNFKGFKFGDIDDNILKIKKRLAIEGDFPKKSVYNEYFNKELMDAMQSYKSRYNLEQNNLIDKIMIYYMNKPIHLQVQSIIDNLDKLKVFPNRFPNEYILINIPDFTMDYYRDGVSILHMNAVIGRDKRPTPLFSSSMTYLVLNPTWNIPENLVRKDLIPTLIKEPDYMEKHNIQVYNGWKSKKNIKNFDISKLLPYQDESKGHIPYRFVQLPGDENALGRIKFMFPNKYSVYLHDTDNKSLFSRRYRVYSSGCMRIQKPFELLEVLKSRLKKRDIKKIPELRESLKTATMRFTHPLPVQTAYFTVFKRDGLTYFRKDIYGYDKFIQESVIKENSL
jgi:murein L,D-transpeptidase YcbB/YkuD